MFTHLLPLILAKGNAEIWITIMLIEIKLNDILIFSI